MTNKQRNNGIIRTSIIGIIGNIFLATSKIIIAIIVSSASILSDGLNNFTDSLGSIITIVGTKLSMKKPTKKHPFGFGRFEYITSTIIGFIILAVGLTAVNDSIVSLIDYYSKGEKASFNLVSIIIVAVAIFVKLALAIIYKINAKRYNSLTLKGSGTDAFFDVILTSATLVSALVGFFFDFYIEGYVGLIIAGFIIKSGIQLIIEAMSQLLGKRLDSEFTNKLKQEIASINGVMGVYDLIIHDYGNNKFIGSVHVGVANTLDVHEVQELERAIQKEVYMKHGIIMTVGIYAQNRETEFSNKIRGRIFELIKDNKNVIQLHGFFVDEKDSYVSFDLVFSFDEKKPEEYVSQIKEILQKEFKDLTFIINIDYDFA